MSLGEIQRNKKSTEFDNRYITCVARLVDGLGSSLTADRYESCYQQTNDDMISTFSYVVTCAHFFLAVICHRSDNYGKHNVTQKEMSSLVKEMPSHFKKEVKLDYGNFLPTFTLIKFFLFSL